MYICTYMYLYMYTYIYVYRERVGGFWEKTKINVAF